jgi:hypothetical protein
MSEDGQSSNKKPDVSIGRRGFLKGAGATGAALGAAVPDRNADIYAYLQSPPGRRPVRTFPSRKQQLRMEDRMRDLACCASHLLAAR